MLGAHCVITQTLEALLHTHTYAQGYYFNPELVLELCSLECYISLLYVFNIELGFITQYKI